MKILVYSLEGDGGGLAYKMVKEGAQVDLFIQEKSLRRQMDGFVPKVESLEEGLKNKPDLILFDLNGEGETADKLRNDGWKVVGGSKLADRMEFDREWGVKLCEQYGIRVPRTTRFKDIESAIAFVKQGKKAYAVKMDSNAGGESASYVSKDYQDMVDYLIQQKESGKIGSNTFIIQEVVKGVEVSTEIWCSDGIPIRSSINSTFENKKFLAGELGQRTGCEVSLVCHYSGDQTKLGQRTVDRLFPLLKHSKWTGPIDANAIVSEEDHEPYFLEFTPRLGYSAIYAYMAVLNMPISEFFFRVSRGSFTVPYKSIYGSSLKLSIPPYPTQIENEKAAKETYELQQGVKINGKYGPDFVPIDVQKGQKDGLECTGSTCIIGECLGRGNSILEAWRASQRVFKSVDVPNPQGRYTDGVEDIWKRALKLRQFGYDIPKPSGGGAEPITPLAKVPSPV